MKKQRLLHQLVINIIAVIKIFYEKFSIKITFKKSSDFIINSGAYTIKLQYHQMQYIKRAIRLYNLFSIRPSTEPFMF